jgi:hypothetical protein
MQLHCGYIFHCPILSNPVFFDPGKLPFLGKFDSSSSSKRGDEFIMPVFHPPETPV